MKNNKGITLIALVVTIIILIILAGVGTYSGIESMKKARAQTLVSQLNMVQQIVLENYTKYLKTKDITPEESKNNYIIGTSLQYSDVKTLATELEVSKLKTPDYDSKAESEIDITEYYYRLNKADLEKMGITKPEDNEDEYIVNYSTGEVINSTVKVTGIGDKLYTYSVDNN